AAVLTGQASAGPGPHGPPGHLAVGGQSALTRPTVVVLQPHPARQGAARGCREQAGRQALRHQRRKSWQDRLHPAGLPGVGGRRAHHADHEDGVRLRLPHRTQGVRRRHNRRPLQPSRCRHRRCIRGPGRAVQRLLHIFCVQGRACVPADHPRPARQVAPARRLRGARGVTRQVPPSSSPTVVTSGGSRVGLWIRRVLLIALLAGLVALPFVADAFTLRLANVIGVNALVVLGLVLLAGYAGLASLGQAAFVGTGAYVAAILASTYGMNPWLSVVAGILASIVIAWLIGLITLRLKGHFLALATLAWGLVITGILRNWMDVTGGNTGFGSATGNRIPPLSFFGDAIRGDREYFVLVWGALLLAVWLVLNLMRSRVGRAIKSLRGGAIAAASFGVDVQRIKMITFLIAAALAA